MGRPDRCGVTGKLIYAAKEAAQGALTAVNSHFNNTRVRKVVPKRCIFCEGYHHGTGKRDGRFRGR